MDKVLVKVFLPIIFEQYEVWIPVNKTIYSTIQLLLKGINDLNGKNYIVKEEKFVNLYNKQTGKIYDLNEKILNTDISNGTELILI